MKTSDVVKLKSGGACMCIIKIEGPLAICKSFQKGAERTHVFLIDDLAVFETPEMAKINIATLQSIRPFHKIINHKISS